MSCALNNTNIKDLDLKDQKVAIFYMVMRSATSIQESRCNHYDEDMDSCKKSYEDHVQSIWKPFILVGAGWRACFTCLWRPPVTSTSWSTFGVKWWILFLAGRLLLRSPNNNKLHLFCIQFRQSPQIGQCQTPRVLTLKFNFIFSQGELKGTEIRWQREPKTQIFAENRRFSANSPLLLEIQAFGGHRIFAENRRFSQIGLRHLRCVTFSSALFSMVGAPAKNRLQSH